jgi:hypothetical protein
MKSLFFQRMFQEFCRRILTKPGNLNANFTHGQMDEAKHQLELAEKKLNRGFKNEY